MAHWRSMAFASLFGLAILGGCTSDDGIFGSDDDRDDDAITAGDVERSTGAAKKLPTDARVVDEGRGTSLTYEARDSGAIHLFDDTANTVVFSKKVKDGDRVMVDPDKNRIEINNRQEGDIDLASDHRFRLYFQPR